MGERESSRRQLAIRATVHCLTGCSIGEVLGLVLGLALASATLSITLREVVDNAIMLLIPGAMDAPHSHHGR